MNTPTRGSLTSTSQIEVDWSTLSSPEDGYSSILSYHLQWDEGSAGVSWYDLVGATVDSTADTYIVTSTITGGQSYQFKVRAKNKWGWGDYSAIASFKASEAPDQMDPVTTSIDAITGGVKIEWVAPSSNFDTITAYMIEIQETSTTFTEDLTNCNGATSTIIANLYCIIPMSTLIGSPYLLTQGDLVTVQIRAYNQYGFSAYSAVNTVGATVKTKPVQMGALSRGSATSIS
mmetsp:Transcript_29134/g.28192  ORF Transcript_29134/g.28192 Transcript_29134/m.28192 type:complete len:232 (-) Transcript_29134:211-906(-)